MKANRVEHMDFDGGAQRGDYEFAVDQAGVPSSLIFCCPGCGSVSSISISGDAHPTWQWDGNVEAPTLKPSINHVGCWHGFLTAGEFAP